MSGDHNMNQTDPGWRKRQIALDVKAENARELGLDYEPNKTIMEMAREAGIRDCTCNGTLKCLEAFAKLIRADERKSWPLEMEAMERQVNILTDALAKAKDDTEAHYKGVIDDVQKMFDDKRKAQTEQEPVGTVGLLFDENVILRRRLDRDLLVYTTPPQRKPLTLDELKALWNSQADQMNQWNELGIDEIVAFAQDDHGIKENK
jgi:hypothetical protein